MNQFLELLSVVIAFATLMLLLSLIVTSVVQTTQYVFQMRMRTLQRGLEDLLATSLGAAAHLRADADPPRADSVKELVQKILTSPYLVQGRVGRRFRADGRLRTFLSSIRRTSWIEKDELKALLRMERAWLGDATAQVLRDVDRWFERLEANTRKEFLVRVRWVTLACALAVAVVFQVDAFESLREISTDPGLRQGLSALSGELLEETQAEIAELRDERKVAEEALLRLEAETEDAGIRAAIEEVAGSDPDREDQLAELEQALESHGVAEEARQEVLRQYGELLGGIASERLKRAEAMRSHAMGHLAHFNITPWGRTREFYWQKGAGLRGLQLTHLLGVLVTAAFLSLGAPFWFNQLKNLVALRDGLEKSLGKK